MFKLANQVLDAYDDADKTLLRKLAAENPQCIMLGEEEKAKLYDDDFAISIITKKASKLNKFPVDSADSTWLSNAYFNETHYRLPKEAAEIAAYYIKQACERFAITPTPAVESLAKQASSNLYMETDLPTSSKVERKQDIDLSKFAQVEQISNNYTYAQFAFPTAAHTKLANKYFDQYSDTFPLEYRHKYACSLQKRAGELGFTLKGKISKYAADHYSAHLGGHLASRRSLLEVADPKFVTALDKMAAMKSSMAPIDFARLLHGFDKRANLEQYYDGYLADPYVATLTHAPTKTASGLSQDVVEKLATEKYAKIKEYFGSSVADALKKEGMSIFESLPNDAKEIIAGIADGSL